ncbi:MAG: hypothetical protein K6F86_03480 [Lachnospiraceae bacterium]|nr:hypothetical protein [Lachnospiraceae bacterium]
MKVQMLIMLTIAFIIASTTPIYAGLSDYSEKTQQLMKEAGFEETPDWEEINRRQIERRKRIEAKKKAVSGKASVKTTSGQGNIYGAKSSYDEFHTAPVDIPANDNYRSGSFDELHVNENYSQDVWHPEDRGMRINGFDEFHFPDEM